MVTRQRFSSPSSKAKLPLLLVNQTLRQPVRRMFRRFYHTYVMRKNFVPVEYTCELAISYMSAIKHVAGSMGWMVSEHEEFASLENMYK